MSRVYAASMGCNAVKGNADGDGVVIWEKEKDGGVAGQARR